MDPEQQAMLMMLLQQMFMPPMNSKGVEEPYDLDTQGKYRNAFQDTLTSASDPAMAMLAGPGAFAPGALDPYIDEFDPIKTPQSDTLNYLAQLGGFEGTVAEMVLNGMTASQITRRLQAAVQNPETSGMSQDELDDLRAGMPLVPGYAGQPGTEIDWSGVTKSVSDLATPFYVEQSTLQQPNVREVNGRYFTEKPSAQMEWLRKQGLPDPRAQYSAEFMAENDPEVAKLYDTASKQASAYDTDTKRYNADMKVRDSYEREAPGRQSMAMKAKTEAMKRFTDALTGSFGTLRDMAADPNPAPTNNLPSYINGGNGSAEQPPEFGRIGLPSLTAPTQGPMPAGLENFWLPGGKDRTLQMAAPAGGNVNRRQSEIRNLAAKRAAGTETYALARALIPALVAQRSGRSPYQDAINARLSPLRQIGAIG
jgi:hypothetical protein